MEGIILLIIGLVGYCEVSALVTKGGIDVNVGQHLNIVSHGRHPLEDEGRGWRDAQSDVFQLFSTSGLRVERQIFNSTISTYSQTHKVTGENIIGISEGPSKDGVIVVGVDLDTTQELSPLHYNGVAVAVLLEVARCFSNNLQLQLYRLNHTVIFVAFDLNTRKYYTKGPGVPGAEQFVQNWLMPFIEHDASRLRGAIILDSLSTYNTAPQTQHLVPGFEYTFPSAYDTIVGSRYRGDFLAMLSRKDHTDTQISQQFTDNYMMERRMKKYRLQELSLGSGSRVTDEVLEMINWQGHFYFWVNDPPLPAILLTDMGVTRAPSDGDCQNSCSVTEFWTVDRESFVTATAKALLQTLLQLQTTKMESVDINDNDGDGVSVISGQLYILIISFLMLCLMNNMKLH